MKSLGKILYKYRSYTPIPFLLVMIIFAIPNNTSIIIGLTIAVLGESIRLWGVSYFGSVSRATSQFVEASLITQGPFSYLRNPLYLGNIIIYFGLGIMSLALFPYLQIFALIYFTFQYYCIIFNEEEYLYSKFQDTFTVYKSTVKRFLPKKNELPEEIKSKLSFNIKSGFKSEKRSLQAIVITILIILILHLSDLKLWKLFV